MLSNRSKKIESLCAIIKIWQDPIHATHVPYSAVQHDIAEAGLYTSFAGLKRATTAGPNRGTFA